MKQFIVFASALALTTVASAAAAQLELVSGTIGAGNTLTLAVVADVGVSSVSIAGLWDNDLGGSVANFVPHATLPGSIEILNYNGAVHKGYLAYGGLFISTGAQVAAGTTLLTFDYTLPSSWNGEYFRISPMMTGDTLYADFGEGEQGFELEADSSVTTTGAVGVLISGYGVIPEPMAMSLLAIGGLVVLRRRHA